MRRLLLPCAVLAAAFSFQQGWWPVDAAPQTLLRASRAAFLVAFVLAGWFRRGRMAAAAVLLAAAAEALRLDPPPLGPVLPAVGLLVPINLALLAALGEQRVVSGAGLARFAAIGLQAAAVVALAGAEEVGFVARVDELLRTSWAETPPLPWTQPALVGFALAAVVLSWRFVRRRTPLEAGFLGVLAASFAALGSERAVLWWLAAAAILVLCQLENAFRLAFEDGLTGLPARRALEERLGELGRRYAIAMIDVDHFKRLNDRYGHEVGDQVLRRIASRLARVGGGGGAYRYGGEEFAVVFAGKSAQEAAPHLEELRAKIAGRPFTIRAPGRPRRKPKGWRGRGGGQPIRVTVSLGVADHNPRRPRPEMVIEAADRALYRSKKAGRNRLTVG